MNGGIVAGIDDCSWRSVGARMIGKYQLPGIWTKHRTTRNQNSRARVAAAGLRFRGRHFSPDFVFFCFFGNASINLPTFAAVLLDSLVFLVWGRPGPFLLGTSTSKTFPVRHQHLKNQKTKESKSTAAKVGKLTEAFPKNPKTNKIWKEMAASKVGSCSCAPRAVFLVLRT